MKTPKRISDFPRVLQDALACWQGLRKLGFPSDDIYFGTDQQRKTVLVSLRRGQLDASIRIGTWDTVHDGDFEVAYRKLVAVASTTNASDLNKNFRESAMGPGGKAGPTIVAALLMAGFTLPFEAN